MPEHDSGSAWTNNVNLRAGCCGGSEREWEDGLLATVWGIERGCGCAGIGERIAYLGARAAFVFIERSI
jgi:hypothetical protein